MWANTHPLPQYRLYYFTSLKDLNVGVIGSIWTLLTKKKKRSQLFVLLQTISILFIHLYAIIKLTLSQVSWIRRVFLRILPLRSNYLLPTSQTLVSAHLKTSWFSCPSFLKPSQSCFVLLPCNYSILSHCMLPSSKRGKVEKGNTWYKYNSRCPIADYNYKGVIIALHKFSQQVSRIAFLSIVYGILCLER